MVELEGSWRVIGVSGREKGREGHELRKEGDERGDVCEEEENQCQSCSLVNDLTFRSLDHVRGDEEKMVRLDIGGGFCLKEEEMGRLDIGGCFCLKGEEILKEEL